MATIQNSRVAKLSALLIDDMSNMRANLRAQLQQLGLRDVVQAASATEALKLLSARVPELVLCDFNLGGDTNGQQLLEHARAKELLHPGTIWFMVTAESSYDYVASASDCAPDDYLIKPFTAANLESRLLRHFERKDALEPALKRVAAGDLETAIAQCTRIEQSGSKFTMDALRLKAQCLTRLNRHGEAKAIYAQALSIRQGVPWAELGFARALRESGEIDKACSVATSIVASNPSFVGAYELLAEIHQERGEMQESLEALRKAEGVVPSTARTRALGEMAVRAGDMEAAKAAYTKVVAATRSSLTRSPYDSAALAQIYVDTGEAQKALELLKPAQKEYSGDDSFQAMASAVQARAYGSIGDRDAADAALERALQLSKDAGASASLAVSKACFALGRNDEGDDIVRAAVRANHEDAEVVAAAKRTLKEAGREECTGDLVDAEVKEMLALTERALGLAKKAQLAEAQAIIAEAAAGLPNNVGVLVAAAQINLLVLSQQGLNVEAATRVRELLGRLERLAPGAERVIKMNAFFKELLLKARAEAAA